MNTLFILLGPTAVGKTETSLQLAEELGSPILSCDSRQIYRDLPVCTAAPTADDLTRVKHYFIGTHGLEDPFSAAQFEGEALRVLQEECPMPGVVMTGGSMMYIDAIIKGIDDMPQADPSIRERLKSQAEAEGLEPLLVRLRELDPVYFASVDQKNPMRVIHGLEMCLTTGRPFSSFRTGQKKERPFRIVQFGLRRDRADLYQRIDRRVDLMFEQGLEQETLRVYERYQQTIDLQFASVIRNPGPTQAQPIPNLFPTALNTVGLKEMLLHYTGVYSLEQARERICHNSHVYSKKQMTWFQRNPEIIWFEAEEALMQILAKSNEKTCYRTYF